METAFAPLLDPGKYDDPSFVNTPTAISSAQQSAKQSVNPVIPRALAPQSLEEQLKAEGSGTSTLSTILAIAGAAKGDFRGLQAIEESKRRTALAKSMIPNITKVNTLVNNGQWEEASSFVNDLASSYGTRADYLVPYFQQMQSSIQKKQEGWNTLKGVYEYYKERIPEDNPRYKTVQALAKAVERRDQISETALQGMLTRDVPHIQYLEGRMVAVDPYSLQTTTEQLPAVMTESKVDNFAGNTVATQHGLTTGMLADVLNNVKEVKVPSTGTIITPGSTQSNAIKTQYAQLQPVNAALEAAKLVPLEPTQMLQLLKDHGLMEIATRSFAGKSGAVEKALTEHYTRLTEQTAAGIKAQVENNPVELRKLGVPVHFDPANPDTMLTEVQDATLTIDQVRKSGGTIKVIRPEVFDNEIKKAQAGIQSLSLIPSMLSGPDAPKTVGDRLATGVLQNLSARLGYDLSGTATVREQAKTILRTAIEQVENSFGDKITGPNRVELANLKAYAAGDFASTKQILNAVQQTKLRLSQIIQRAVGINPYFQNTPTGGEQPPVQGKPGAAKSPAGAIAPLIPPKGQGQGQGGQVTNPVYDKEGKIVLPPDFDPELTEKIARTALKGQKGGGGTVNIPVGGAPQVVTPTVPTAPKSAEEERAAWVDEKVKQKAAALAAAKKPDIDPSPVTMPQQVTPPYKPNLMPQQFSPLQPLQRGDVTQESENQRIQREANRAVVQQQSAPQVDRYKAMRDAIYKAALAEAARKRKR